MIEHFSRRIGDLEVRTCDFQLLQKDEHTTIEIVNHTKEGGSYNIAFWKQHSEFASLRIRDNVPLHIIDGKTFFKLATIGQKHLKTAK